MKPLRLLVAASALAAPALAQIGDATAPCSNRYVGMQPAGNLAPTAAWNDDFNRPDAATLGAAWFPRAGMHGIVQHRGWGMTLGHTWTQHQTASSMYAGAVMSIDFLPRIADPSLVYVALIFGVGTSGDVVFLKAQDNDGDGLYDTVWFYGANHNPWVSAEPYGIFLATPTASGRMTCYFTGGGDVANIDIDRDFDGVVDEHFQRSGVLGAGYTLGTGMAIGTFNYAAFDNFNAHSSFIDIVQGAPPCAASELDFDLPFVPSGTIPINSPVFTSKGIASVTPFGSWVSTGDTITAGSNYSGQSLVVQGAGAGTLAIAGLNQPLSSPNANAGFDIQLLAPASAFGVLFIDQVGFEYWVELRRSGVSLGMAAATYGSSFPVPPVRFTAGQGLFDQVRISFPHGSGGVGIDDLTIVSSFFDVSGPGGAFPTATTGSSGVYPHLTQTGTPSMPERFFSSNVAVPAGVERFTAVVLRNLVHAWSGDAHFALKDPAGQRFNVCTPPNKFNTSGWGNNCVYQGDYVFVDPIEVAQQFPPDSSGGCTGSLFPPGVYDQYFGSGNGSWPPLNGNPQPNLGILNVPLNQIPVIPGVWTLECYDWWLGGDSGSFTSWELHGNFHQPCEPNTYCVAGETWNGCFATISATGNPSVSFAGPCVLHVSGVEGQKSGILFYGLTAIATPWCPGGTSMLCVKAPAQRTGTQSSGGTLGGCDGNLWLDWNAFQLANPTALGQPFVAGDRAYVQAWFRDPPSCKTTSLSDAIELTYQP